MQILFFGFACHPSGINMFGGGSLCALLFVLFVPFSVLRTVLFVASLCILDFCRLCATFCAVLCGVLVLYAVLDILFRRLFVPVPSFAPFLIRFSVRLFDLLAIPLFAPLLMAFSVLFLVRSSVSIFTRRITRLSSVFG